MSSPTWQRVHRSSAALSSTAVREMSDLGWFAALPPESRSDVGLVVQAGLAGFAQWLRYPGQPVPVGPEVFAAAPRELARAITLKQTVQLVRVAVDVVERAIEDLAAPDEETLLREAVLRYSREIAFAAADVYAAAAEARGAWDARVEAGVVDALVRGHAGELTLSRASALGWSRVDWVVALAAAIDEEPAGAPLRELGAEQLAAPGTPDLRATSRQAGLSLLTGESGPALLVVLGGAAPQVPAAAVELVLPMLPPGPVVVGPTVSSLMHAATCVQEALGALAAVRAWPGAPRPVPAADLLSERAVLGEPAARQRLLEDVYAPLVAAGPDLLATAAAYLEGGGSVEGTGRALFLHPNTVRYRLKRLTDVLGRDLTAPREGLVVRMALLLGRSAR